MVNFKDHDKALQMLSKAQDADSDMRDQVRETNAFLTARDGQWEAGYLPDIKMPKYTLDKCNPIVDSIASQIEEQEFSVKVKPADGQASKDTAVIYDGLIRNIQNISNAVAVFNGVSRRSIATGLSGCRVVQEYASPDSFDQDLMIKPLSDFENRVWFGPYELPDASDAMYCWVFEAMSPDDYEAQYPEGSKQGLTQDFWEDIWFDKPDVIMVAEFIYKTYKTVELVKMSDGEVYEDDDDFKKVVEELRETGVMEVNRKTKRICEIKTRMMDGKDWLTPEQDTVFRDLPVIQCAANFQITQNKPVYWGAIDKLLDQQRLYNYSFSKQVAETALAPTETIVMTKQQAVGNDYSRINSNPKPIITYTHVDGQPAPYKMPPPNVNPALEVIKQSTSNDINVSAGQFNANMGNNAGLQSGAAIGLQIDKGDSSNLKYVQDREAFVGRVGQILVNAIPYTYDAERQIRIVGEDGTEDMETINTSIFDNETQQVVELNNMAAGTYDVVCNAQKTFKNRQDTMNNTILQLAAVKPEILDFAADIILKNADGAGLDAISERYRAQMLPQGIIPQEQWTDEELAQAQAAQQAAAQQPQEPTIDEQLAQSQLMMGQAELQKVQVQTANLQQEGQIAAMKLDQSQQTLDMKGDEQAFRQQLDVNRQLTERMNTMADTMNKLVEATGSEGIAGPSTMQAVANQAQMITGEQNDMGAMTNEQLMEVVRNG
jgi:hypothetical protein